VVDIAVDLVESYLRLNGYLTLSEMDVVERRADGSYRSVTDVDVVAVRFPGDVYAAYTPDPVQSRLLLIEDQALDLPSGMIDVVIGEVKQGEARFNPGLKRRQVLETILRRLDWIYQGGIEGIVDDLQRSGLSEARARSGADIRTRLVAFGAHPGEPSLHVIPLGHVIRYMVRFMQEFDEVLNPARFSHPAAAMIRLLVKCGFEVTPRDPH
jgi:hypothetical protein